jgi:cytochrome oxidase assembly protein ShyY1
MIDIWLALIVAGSVLAGYLLGVWQVLRDTREETALRNRQKFDTMKAMQYTKRGR